MALDQTIIYALEKCRQKLHNAKFNYDSSKAEFNSIALLGYENWCASMNSTKNSLITKIQNYLINNNQTLNTLDDPQLPGITDPIGLMINIFKIEILCSVSLETATRLPALENDNASYQFIRGLVDEQTEEEATASELLERSKVFYNVQLPSFGLSEIDDSLK
jgi:ferritin